MSLNDIRESFLSYFESQGHLRLDSFSLVPKNDKSILLINAGMTPLKKYFTGEEVPPRRRVATCQKCIRTPDLDSMIVALFLVWHDVVLGRDFGDGNVLYSLIKLHFHCLLWF